MGTGGAFPGEKRPGREADHSPPFSAEVKKMLIYTFTPHTPLWHSASLVKQTDNFTFFTIFINLKAFTSGLTVATIFSYHITIE
jgi:hypothetical protein